MGPRAARGREARAAARLGGRTAKRSRGGGATHGPITRPEADPPRSVARNIIAMGSAVALLALAGQACSGENVVSQRVQECRDMCEAGKVCPPPDTTPAATDCFTLCDDLDALNQSGGCTAQFDSLYQCFQVHGTCGTDCSSRRQVYSDCIAEHCSADPNRDDCGGIPQ